MRYQRDLVTRSQSRSVAAVAPFCSAAGRDFRGRFLPRAKPQNPHISFAGVRAAVPGLATPGAKRRIANSSGMDKGLTDLDALLLTVRNARTRVYLGEAILAYRTGAYRLAIVGTWTAVAYDIIAKARELASEGDNAAATFVKDFDRNVESDNKSKLLQIERDLLTTAAKQFSFFGPHDEQILRRLLEDRNVCAHPAFSNANELYRPSPDVVRAHIAQSVEVLLAMPPLSGKLLIEKFAIDLPTSAFPRDRERAISYVKDRYLARMRDTAKHNFAIVVLKGLLRANVLEWSGHENSLLHALEAVERDNSRAFGAEVISDAAEMIDKLEGDDILGALRLMRSFPLLISHLRSTTIDRIHAIVTSPSKHPSILEAIGMFSTEIDAAVVDRVRNMSAAEASAALQTYPDAVFVPAVLDSLRAAQSFREGEARLLNVELLQECMKPGDFGRVFSIIGENKQVGYANLARGATLRLATYAIEHNVAGEVNWAHLYDCRIGDGYAELWALLAAKRIYDAPGTYE
jgi:hypothetical protein